MNLTKAKHQLGTKKIDAILQFVISKDNIIRLLS